MSNAIAIGDLQKGMMVSNICEPQPPHTIAGGRDAVVGRDVIDCTKPLYFTPFCHCMHCDDTSIPKNSAGEPMKYLLDVVSKEEITQYGQDGAIERYYASLRG